MINWMINCSLPVQEVALAKLINDRERSSRIALLSHENYFCPGKVDSFCQLSPLQVCTHGQKKGGRRREVCHAVMDTGKPRKTEFKGPSFIGRYLLLPIWGIKGYKMNSTFSQENYRYSWVRYSGVQLYLDTDYVRQIPFDFTIILLDSFMLL